MRLGVHFTGTILRSSLMVTLLFFCLVALIEIVEIGNRADLSLFTSPLTTLGAAAITSTIWALDLLPISFLVGSVLALMELQNNRALIVAKTSGVSIWGIAKWPALACALFGLFVTFAIEPAALWANKALEEQVGVVDGNKYVQLGKKKWIVQENDRGKFYLRADAVSEDGLDLQDTVLFQHDSNAQVSMRLDAESARFDGSAWTFKNGAFILSDGTRRVFDETQIESFSSKEELSLQLGSILQMDVYTLRQYVETIDKNNQNIAAAITRLRQMEVLPALLVGALLIAFAFTTGYRRHGTSGTQVLYGIVLGFVLYVITKLLDRAGEAGSMDATLAAWGPAIVTIVIGTSVLLWKEDG
jgi:lipopolysaccharide export system permease protein